jgi:hypothetical protein
MLPIEPSLLDTSYQGVDGGQIDHVPFNVFPDEKDLPAAKGANVMDPLQQN